MALESKRQRRRFSRYYLQLTDFPVIETGKGKPAPNDVKIDNWN
jgi:hypothetical protein